MCLLLNTSENYLILLTEVPVYSFCTVQFSVEFMFSLVYGSYTA